MIVYVSNDRVTYIHPPHPCIEGKKAGSLLHKLRAKGREENMCERYKCLVHMHDIDLFSRQTKS